MCAPHLCAPWQALLVPQFFYFFANSSCVAAPICSSALPIEDDADSDALEEGSPAELADSLLRPALAVLDRISEAVCVPEAGCVQIQLFLYVFFWLFLGLVVFFGRHKVICQDDAML